MCNVNMVYSIRKWKLDDAADISKVLNNTKIIENLRDGIPYPYTEKDAEEFITAMLSSDENKTYSCRHSDIPYRGKHVRAWLSGCCLAAQYQDRKSVV